MSESGYRKGHIPPANSMERGYLIEDSKLKPQHESKHSLPQYPIPAPAPLPPIVGELVIPTQTTVSDLAKLLSEKPFRIIADLMGLGVFATVEQALDFKTISSIARKYGFIAKRAA
jgi:hypothetical protein